jgi:RND family efflux transporter MFP subunit
MPAEKPTLDQLRIDRVNGEEPRSRAWVVFVVLAVLLVLAGLGWRFAPGRVTVVSTVVAKETELTGPRTVLNASGYVVARREATVSSKITGKVIEVSIEEGMKVEAGQILARLDDINVRVSLQLAQAQLDAARSALGETTVLLAQAEREAGRIQRLAQEKIASASELDQAQAQEASLRARLERLKADTAVGERELAVWQQQLEDTLIRAPFTGVVTVKNAQPGEMISPISAGGGFTRTGICTLVDMASLEIEVDVNESYINRVTAGQPVEASLDAYPDWRIPAKVIAVIPTADRQKSTVRVRIGFEKLEPRILPQMGIKVAFQEGAEKMAGLKVILVPRQAVQKQGAKDTVLVVRQGKAERATLVSGGVKGDEIMVTSGLVVGERIITPVPKNLKEGAPVKEARP